MMKTLTIWVLAGALLASLRWNLTDMQPCAPATSGIVRSGAALECEIDASSLGLSADQSKALESYCRKRSQTQSDYRTKADLKLAELHGLLGLEELDEARLSALVEEITELRRRALNACVDEVIGVRTILNAPQIQQLMDSCCSQQGCELRSSFGE